MTSSALPGALLFPVDATPRCLDTAPELTSSGVHQLPANTFLDLLLDGIGELADLDEFAVDQDLPTKVAPSPRILETAGPSPLPETHSHHLSALESKEDGEPAAAVTNPRPPIGLLAVAPVTLAVLPAQVRPFALTLPSPEITDRHTSDSAPHEWKTAVVQEPAAAAQDVAPPDSGTTAGSRRRAPTLEQATVLTLAPAIAPITTPRASDDLIPSPGVAGHGAAAGGTASEISLTHPLAVALPGLEPAATRTCATTAEQGRHVIPAAPIPLSQLDQFPARSPAGEVTPGPGPQAGRAVSGATTSGFFVSDIEASQTSPSLLPVAVSGRMQLRDPVALHPHGNPPPLSPGPDRLPLAARVVALPPQQTNTGPAPTARNPRPQAAQPAFALLHPPESECSASNPQEAPRVPASRASGTAGDASPGLWPNHEVPRTEAPTVQNEFAGPDTSRPTQPGALPNGEAFSRSTQSPIQSSLPQDNPRDLPKSAPLILSPSELDTLEPAPPKSALRELAVQLKSADGQRVDLQFVESGGGVNLRIRTADLGMQAELGAELRQFEADTQSRGWKTEMRPAAAHVEDRLAPRAEDRHSLVDRAAQLKASETAVTKPSHAGMQFGRDSQASRQARDWQAEQQELMEMSALRRLSNKGGKA